MTPLLKVERSNFHKMLLETCLTVDDDGIPSIADVKNKTSIEISKKIVSKIGSAKTEKKASGQSLGLAFESACSEFLKKTFLKLENLRPGEWEIIHLRGRGSVAIADYEQYGHLKYLAQLAAANKELAATLGNDYAISPDIVICRKPVSDDFINSNEMIVDDTTALTAAIRLHNNHIPVLHASVSCKWTMRSDRAQNARSEALNLIRNRKGHAPHIAVVTAEPTPSRISSIALGTGDIDCVYHFALYELKQSLDDLANDEASNLFSIMVDGKRLKDISDLPLDLAI